MVQIIFRGQAATIATTTEAITTGNVQQLPAWAPPIAYIGTTSPWKVEYLKFTTAVTTYQHAVMKQAKVYQYGHKAALHGGIGVFTLNMPTNDATHIPLITITYNAVGDLTRP